MYALVWLLVAMVLGIAELFSLSFVLLMLAGGALAAAGSALLGWSLAWQLVVFGVASVLALVAVRPFVVRARDRVDAEHSDDIGVEQLEGAEAVVTEQVTSGSGLIKIGGIEWTARTLDETQTIEPGSKVNVIEIRGVTAIVWRQ